MDRTLFDRAQAALHSRAPAVMHPRQVFGSFLLAGLVFCSGCGAAMTSHSAKSGKHHYYACSARTKGRDDGCTQPLTRREVLENADIARTRNRLLSDDNLSELVDLVNGEIAAMGEENAGQIQTLDIEIGDVSRRLEKYYGLLRARGTGPCGDEPAGFGVEGTACDACRAAQIFGPGGQGSGRQAEGAA